MIRKGYVPLLLLGVFALGCQSEYDDDPNTNGETGGEPPGSFGGENSTPGGGGAGNPGGRSSTPGNAGRAAGGGNSGNSGGSTNPGGGGPSPSTGGSMVAVPENCDDGVPHPAVNDMRRISRAQYERAIEVIFDGRVEPSGVFPRAVGESASGYSTEAELNALGEQGVNDVITAAEEVALQVPAIANNAGCDGAAGQDCAIQFIDRYVRRAFRRTVTADERALLLGVYNDAVGDGASFGDAMGMLTAQMLQMPQFLYVAEDAAGDSRELNQVELASRLAFLYTDSVPDDELLDAAEAGELDSVEALRSQAIRLMETANADSSLSRFIREWTGTRELAAPDKDQALYPEFTAAVANSINESFNRFAVSIFRDQGTVHTLFRSPDAFVDRNMAAFLGVTAPAAGQWSRVTLDENIYSGVMTQPALLASLAHSDKTSYVYRGKFIRKHVLCQAIGAPPATAMAEFDQIELPTNPTAKDTSAGVRARGGCGGCHGLMDPGGLAFENFDATGKYIEEYRSGKPIDPSGELTAVPGADGGSIVFADQVDLVAQMADLPAVRACFAHEIFRFAMSRMEMEADKCTIAALETAMAPTDVPISDVLIDVVSTDAFRYRVDP